MHPTMKKTATTLLLTLALISGVSASIAFKSFVLEPGFNKVTLKWEVQNEGSIRGYEIERGVTESNLTKIAFVRPSEAAGPSKKYEYTDTKVFKPSSNPARTYYYRLKVIHQDNSSKYSKVERVTPTISSARQTWGSIKAMFR